MGRRSGDRERYDADPQLLGDDFSALELRDSEGLPSPVNPILLRPLLIILQHLHQNHQGDHLPTQICTNQLLPHPTDVRYLSRRVHHQRSAIFMIPPNRPNVRPRGASRANGSRWPQWSRRLSQRMIRSAWETAKMREILRPKSRIILMRLIVSRRLRQRQWLASLVLQRTTIRHRPLESHSIRTALERVLFDSGYHLLRLLLCPVHLPPFSICVYSRFYDTRDAMT